MQTEVCRQDGSLNDEYGSRQPLGIMREAGCAKIVHRSAVAFGLLVSMNCCLACLHRAVRLSQLSPCASAGLSLSCYFVGIPVAFAWPSLTL